MNQIIEGGPEPVRRRGRQGAKRIAYDIQSIRQLVQGLIDAHPRNIAREKFSEAAEADRRIREAVYEYSFSNAVLWNETRGEHPDAGQGGVDLSPPDGHVARSLASSGSDAAVGGHIRGSNNGHGAESADSPRWEDPDRPQPDYSYREREAIEEVERLLGIKIDGKDLISCTIGEIAGYIAQRELDARRATADVRFLKMVIANLPADDRALGSHRSAEELRRIAAL